MNNKTNRTTAAVIILMLFVSVRAMAATQFFFDLEPGQEVPPVVSSGSGSCEVTLDGTSVSVLCQFEGLSQPAVASHIHGAGVGTNGGVILGLTVTEATSGTISGNGTLTVEQANNMEQGLTYINLHSQAFASGELRGQIVSPASTNTPAIPTISQWGLISLTALLVFLGWLAVRARRVSAG